MTVTSFTLIPDSVACGAQVIFVPSTVKNPSESGNTNRKSLRPVKRNFLFSISPDDSDEMQAVIMATDGDRYPMAMRDPSANHVTNAICQIDPVTGDFLMGRTWAPATGTKTAFERILIPENDLVVKVNGSPATSGTFTILDFGRISFSVVTTGDEVSVTCSYLTPVAALDPPTANAYGSIGGATQYQFASMRFESLFEAELRELLA